MNTDMAQILVRQYDSTGPDHVAVASSPTVVPSIILDIRAGSRTMATTPASPRSMSASSSLRREEALQEILERLRSEMNDMTRTQAETRAATSGQSGYKTTGEDGLSHRRMYD